MSFLEILNMPQISCFLGILIRMFFKDHNPPHFHAFYGENEALININKIELMEGYVPPRVLGLVMEWAVLNQPALTANWERARKGEPLLPIAPLV